MRKKCIKRIFGELVSTVVVLAIWVLFFLLVIKALRVSTGASTIAVAISSLVLFHCLGKIGVEFFRFICDDLTNE